MDTLLPPPNTSVYIPPLVVDLNPLTSSLRHSHLGTFALPTSAFQFVSSSNDNPISSNIDLDNLFYSNTFDMDSLTIKNSFFHLREEQWKGHSPFVMTPKKSSIF